MEGTGKRRRKGKEVGQVLRVGGEVEAHSCGSGGQLEPLKLQNDG